jgi:hypothetical protein
LSDNSSWFEKVDACKCLDSDSLAACVSVKNDVFLYASTVVAGLEKPDFEPSICLSMHERARTRPYDSLFLLKAGGTGSILSEASGQAPHPITIMLKTGLLVKRSWLRRQLYSSASG